MRMFRIGKLPKRFFRITIGVSLVFTALSIGACNEAYKIAEIREGFIHFSFEYPARYQSEPQISTTTSATNWFVSSETANTEGGIVLSIRAHNEEGPSSNAVDWYEDLSEQLASRDIANARNIERSTIKEGLISGKTIAYSWLYDANYKTLTTFVDRFVFFDMNGVPFTVQVAAEQSVSRQAKADLNHLLRTFKILE